MDRYKNLIPPIVLLFLSVAIAVYFRPLMIIDETRYISVAWEMYSSGNYLVPHLNGLPYDHKPPLLFWIIVTIWKIFGVNELVVRFIPFVFGAGLIIVGAKIYKLLFNDDKEGVELFGYVMVAMVVFVFYSTLLMFDIMLSFFVALAIYGGLKALIDDKFSSYLILTLAIGFGILAKSPVILAHLLPLYLFAAIYSPKKVKFSFYIKGLLAVIFGIAIALIWAVPAAKAGGEEFAYGIFWGQYAGRAVNAFAHKRSFWWYLPWIPIILMPWILYKGFFKGVSKIFKAKLDFGVKAILTWLIGSFIIFSLISGKQLAYIAPEFLAFALFATRALSLNKDTFKPYTIALVYLIIAIALFIAPLLIKGYFKIYLDTTAFIVSGILLSLYALYLALYNFKSKKSVIKAISIGATLLIFVLHYTIHLYLKSQDLTNFSKEISKLQNSGIKVAHFGKYHNQYHYIGRLKKPLIILKNSKEIDTYIKNNPNGAIVTYKTRDVKFNKNAVIATTKFRTQNALLVKAKEWNKLLK